MCSKISKIREISVFLIFLIYPDFLDFVYKKKSQIIHKVKFRWSPLEKNHFCIDFKYLKVIV